ncbi:MAG: aspartate-semialdehyde dehydrogenase [Proteobacteria bacterium]|nr:aspartate-semialdehyde dehydrogenase [Pseudomonadota bacterium]
MATSDRANRDLRVAVVGATGAVGEVLLNVLAERKFPVGSLLPLASERSAGSRIQFRGESIAVEEARPDAFEQVDVVFFAATGGLSKSLAPEAVRRGAVVIDKSSTWRMDPRVPLVVPEINPAALDKHEGIISCPNCTTIGAVMTLEPLRRAAGLEEVVITTLQAASGAGVAGTSELEAQEQALQKGEALKSDVFASPLARNAVPVCDAFREDGYTLEERKLTDETRKILGLPSLAVTATCVRVPVPVGHSASILVRTERPLLLDEARTALANFPGVELYDTEAPTAQDVVGRDEVLVGRLRRDLASEGLWLWEVSDNLRKGAATNAVQIAEALGERGLL